MKIEEQEIIEQDSIGQFKEITSSIRTEDLGLAFDMVSKNLYSDPIGSFIREIVSNAVDANIDNNGKNLVKVNISKIDSQWYFSVRDFGVGMNPDIFENVYMKWFNSDKRNTNDKIGGWGLGSKSPLAYVDYYRVRTIAEGIEYDYVIARQNPAPTATLLSEKPTNEENGTEVIIELRQEDLYSVSTKCGKQLAYFDNVIVTNHYSYYDNHFTIYKSEDFIFRNEGNLFGDAMHICLGQVAYPINWVVLGIKTVAIPVALNFKIGELPVVLSRESIDYNNEEVKSIIINKIKKVEEYIKEKYVKSLEFEDFNSYLNCILDDNIRNTLVLGELSINMSSYRKKPVYLPLNLYMNSDNIRAILRYIYRSWTIKGLKLIENHDYDTGNIILHNFYLTSESGMVNIWDIRYVNETERTNNVVAKNKNYKSNLRRIAEEIGMTYKPKKYWERQHLKDGASVMVYKVVNLIYKYYDSKMPESIHNIAPSYWVENQKEEQKRFQKARKDFITYYTLSQERRQTQEISIVSKLSKIILYSIREEDDAYYASYNALINSLPEYYANMFSYILVSRTTANKLKRFDDKFKPVEGIWGIKNLSNHFRRLYLSYRFDTIFPFVNDSYSYSIHYYKKNINKLTNRYTINLVYYYTTDTKMVEGNIFEHFEKEILTKMSKTPLIFEEYLVEFERLSLYFKVFSEVTNKSFVLNKLKMLKFNASLYKQ